MLIEWAWRHQGLVVPAGNPQGLTGLKDLAGGKVTVARRQAAAGSWLLLAQLLERDGTRPRRPELSQPKPRMARPTLGLAVLEGRAQAGLAVEAVARALKLDFVPLFRERYDLLLRRRDFFEPAIQTLLRLRPRRRLQGQGRTDGRLRRFGPGYGAAERTVVKYTRQFAPKPGDSDQPAMLRDAARGGSSCFDRLSMRKVVCRR